MIAAASSRPTSMRVRSLRAPSVVMTTRNSPALYPWQANTALPNTGVLLGVNQLAGSVPFAYDPWECYAAGIISSPNMLIAGQLGTGKSALVKTYLRRQLDCDRQVYVLDPKGEYQALAEVCGLPRVRLAPGGSDRLNPLDPPPNARGAEDVVRARTTVVTALAGGGLGRDLSAEERAAITAATAELGTTPVLAHVIERLLEPSPVMAATLATSSERLAHAVRPVALELRRLLCGDLAGMVDGPSTTRLDPDGPGLVVDLSAVHASDALVPVMVCAGAWLSSALHAGSTRRRLLLVDEAWALLHAAATTRWLQSVSKLARQHGVALLIVVHRLSDLTGQADAGTATAARAHGLLADAETRVIYRQASTERDLAADLLDLTAAETELVTNLPNHRGLWQLGRHAAVVDHILAPDDHTIVDTDARMHA